MRFFLFFFLFLPLLLFSQVTTNGIKYYVTNNGDSTIRNFENFFSVKIDRDLDFESVDILEYSDDSNTLGKCILDLDLIVVSNNENKYAGYTKNELKPRKLKNLKTNSIFVKGVMIHEICHVYIKFLFDSINGERRYKQGSEYGFIFIEEGICEYAVAKMGEEIVSEYYIPKSMNELEDTTKKYKIKYEYSVVFVKKILDKYGFTNGIILLLRNNPPTKEDLLKPEEYYSKLDRFIIQK